MRPALAGVVGDDDAGRDALGQALRDGIDVSAVVRREGARTGLIVDVVDGDGRWRYLEDVPPPVLLAEADVAAAGPLLRDTPWAAVQLQQPPEAVRAAVGLARGDRIVLDGAPSEDDRGDLLAAAFAVRADAREAAMLAGAPIGSADEADALTAALIAALARGEPPERAARFAVAAAGATVGRPGGRPALSFEGVRARAGL